MDKTTAILIGVGVAATATAGAYAWSQQDDLTKQRIKNKVKQFTTSAAKNTADHHRWDSLFNWGRKSESEVLKESALKGATEALVETITQKPRRRFY